MYAQFFNLREMPFSISPDPAYLYMSPRHQEALGHLLYGTGQYGGFVQLTGEVGTGKTTVVRTLLEQKLDSVDVAMIHNPRQSELEFVQSICDELGAPYDRSQFTLKTLVDALNEHLLQAHAAGRRTVLIIDEAQNLDPSVLEQVRLLTNLETSKQKLLRIMLIGQPELSETLGRADLRQLAQRITARYHLMPLEEVETTEYIRHRLRVAGSSEEIFPPDAIREIQRHSRGVPRLINILCDRAMLGAYGQSLRRVTPDIVRKAAVEAIGTPLPALRNELPKLRKSVFTLAGNTRSLLEGALTVAALVIVVALAWQTFFRPAPAPLLPAPPPVAEAKPAAAEPAPVVAAAEPAPAAPPEANLTQLLQTTPALAPLISRLIRLWDAQLTVPAGANVCSWLKTQGIECYKQSGEWKDLRLLDRPAILSLATGRGELSHVLLTGLSPTTATLDTVQGPVTVPTEQLDTVWTGEFLLLWRPAVNETLLLTPGTRSVSVQWLRRRLSEIEGEPLAEPLSDRYDTELAERVRRYQGMRGLEPDGVAGVRTLITLADGTAGTPALGSER